jgi:hypothetical protein
VTPEAEFLLHDMRGTGEDVVDTTGVDLAVEAKIIAQFGRDDGRTGLARGIDIDDGRQLLEFDCDGLSGILGQRPCIGDDCDHRLPRPHHLVDRQWQLRRRFHALEMLHGADPRRAQTGKILPRGDQLYAGHVACSLRLDRNDPCMGVGTSYKGDMKHARQNDVGDIAATAGQKPFGVGTRDRAADVGIRTIE